MALNKYLISALLSVIIFSSSQTVIADPFNTSAELSTEIIGPIFDADFELVLEDPDGLLDAIESSIPIFAGFNCATSGDFALFFFQLPFTLTVRDCQEPPNVTVWEVTSTGATCISPSCFPRVSVGGEMIQVDTVSLVLAYGLVNSWWMAPIGIGIGVGVYLTRRRFVH